MFKKDIGIKTLKIATFMKENWSVNYSQHVSAVSRTN